MVLVWALLPPGLLSVLSGEQSHFLCLGLVVSLKIGNPVGVLAARISDIGRTGGSGLLAWLAGLLTDAGAGEPSNSGVVFYAEASTLGCIRVMNASLTEHMGPVLGLVVAGRNQGSSLTKVPRLIWKRTSLNVMYTCLAILAHWSLWFLANPSCSRSSSCSNWALAWVIACNCLMVMLKLSTASVPEPVSLWECKAVAGTDSSTGGTNHGPCLSSFTGPPWGMGWHLAYLPSFIAGWLKWKSTGVTCIGMAG